MPDFFQVLLSFPVAVYTALVVPVLLYWLALLLGVGGGESAPGLEMDGVDAGRWGAARGFQNRGPERLGLADVPAPILGTFLILWAWFFCYLAVAGARHLTGLAPAALPWAWKTAFLLLSPGLAFLPARASVRPLRGLFEIRTAASKPGLVGRKCRILSRKVDAEMGQAEFDDGGAGFLLHVRCPGENRLARGSAAVLLEYDPEQDVFLVQEDPKKGE